MKKEFVNFFKQKGFRVNSKKGEAFKKNGDLHYFLRLFECIDFDGVPKIYFKFGVHINSPFDTSFWPFENSIYLNEYCYGGEQSDEWDITEFDNLLQIADRVGIPWIDKFMDLDILSEHILWRIENGLRWVEPKQSSKGEYSTRQDIITMLGGSGDVICFEWVKRMYKPLSTVKYLGGNIEEANQYIQLYLDHIAPEDFRSNEIEQINTMLVNGKWEEKS